MKDLSPEARLARLASAYQLSRAVHVAARMGLSRYLADGPRSVEELAQCTACDAHVLRLLLRFLAELGVVAAQPKDRFAATDLTARLHLVDNLAQGPEAWDVWTALPRALEHGRSPFEEVHGAPFFTHARAHPERYRSWLQWHSAAGAQLGNALAHHPGTREVATLVDIGGGGGALLAAFLAQRAQCRGVLLDLPGAIEGAHGLLARAGVIERASVVECDARWHLPPGGDLYLLSRVLFNLDDGDVVEVLRRCRDALGLHGRLWLLEPLARAPEEPLEPGRAAADLHHFLLWGSRHRSLSEFRQLAASADLDLSEIGPLAGCVIVEGCAARG